MSRIQGDERAAQEPPADERPTSQDGAAQAAEDMAGRVVGWAARTAARAREEAEDIWAEAQELRRRW
jgi:hypothetical protein